jgi:hypothetical protein
MFIKIRNRQNPHSKGFTGKILFLNGLGEHETNPGFRAGVFLIYISSLLD